MPAHTGSPQSNLSLNKQSTAQQTFDDGRIAFRLDHDTPLYDAAAAGAAVIATLAAGSLITVREDAGAFLYVITGDDTFGFIADASPVSPMEWTPKLEQAGNIETFGTRFASHRSRFA